MYLCDKYRPISFDDLIGQDDVKNYFKNVIKSIKENSDDFAKNYILYGESGVGKTSFVNVFSKELGAKLYFFDVSLLGNVDDFKNIRQLINEKLIFSRDYVVVCFDEMQEASNVAQSLLLNILEDNVGVRILYFFTTTNIDKILDTIRTRCIEFMFYNISDDDMKNYLVNVCGKENINIDENMLKKIIKFSGGSLRKALNFLDIYRMGKNLGLFDIDFFKIDYNELYKYPFVYLRMLLDVYMLDWFEKNYNVNFILCMKVLEIYYKFRNFIKNVDELILLLKIINKLLCK